MELFSLGGLDFGCELPSFRRRLGIVKWQKDDDNAAHVRNGMVPGRSPETVVFAHCVQQSATLDPRRDWYIINDINAWFFERKNDFKSSRDTY